MKMPRFYCSIGCAYLLHSVSLYLDTNKITFEKMKHANKQKEIGFHLQLFVRGFNENATFH